MHGTCVLCGQIGRLHRISRPNLDEASTIPVCSDCKRAHCPGWWQRQGLWKYQAVAALFMLFPVVLDCTGLAGPRPWEDDGRVFGTAIQLLAFGFMVWAATMTYRGGFDAWIKRRVEKKRAKTAKRAAILKQKEDAARAARQERWIHLSRSSQMGADLHKLGSADELVELEHEFGVWRPPVPEVGVGFLNLRGVRRLELYSGPAPQEEPDRESRQLPLDPPAAELTEQERDEAWLAAMPRDAAK